MDDLTAAPPVTVVIASRDREALLHGALESVAAARRPGDDVIVVDSASRHADVAALAARFGMRSIRCDEPGTCRARNAGWRAASTEIVAFTDDDCRADPTWIETVSTTFGRHPDVSFVTGTIADDDGDRRRAEIRLSLHVPRDPATFAASDDFAVVGHGANMAWRRAVLEELGGFDEELGPGSRFRAAEDQDAFWRALTAGKTGRFEPGARVVHRQWRNRRQQLRTVLGYGVGSGALAIKRWRSALETGGGPPRSGRLLSEVVGAAGRASMSEIGRHLRQRNEIWAVAELVAYAGFLRGSIAARRVAVEDGHFAPAIAR
ncbi:MAG: glycosyltransferase family 2 protein [Acidimicrobiales bacterium]